MSAQLPKLRSYALASCSSPRKPVLAFSKCLFKSRSFVSAVGEAAGSRARRPRQQNEFSNDQRTVVRLSKIPRTTLVPDLRRLLTQIGVASGVKDVLLDYNRFLPSTRAWIHFNSPALLQDALDRLRRATISSIPVQVAVTAEDELGAAALRFRGVAGRREAAQRGVVMGSGPNAGLAVAERGKNVVLWGLPGKLHGEALKGLLKGYALRGESEAGADLVKMEPVGRALTSRHLVRLKSISEAHRLVRAVHMTYYDYGQWGGRYLVRARVVY